MPGKPILIGYWHVAHHEESPFVEPQQLVDPGWDWKPEEKERIADYLDSGVAIMHYLGFSWCRFHCGVDDAEMGTADLTDDMFVWPEGLSHYVREHAVPLPWQFVEHVKANGYLVPGMRDLSEVNGYDVSLWLSWCESQVLRPPAGGATAGAETARLAAVHAGLAAKLGGDGEAACQWAGCERRALRQLAFCAPCAHERMGMWP